MTDLADFKAYVTQLGNTAVYINWAKKNPTDASHWQTFSQAILAGKTPTPPAMSTGFGKSLLIVGAMAVNTAQAKDSIYGISPYGDVTYYG